LNKHVVVFVVRLRYLGAGYCLEIKTFLKMNKTIICKVFLRVLAIFILYFGLASVLGGRPGHGLVNIGFSIYVALCGTDDVLALWHIRNQNLSSVQKVDSPVWFSLLATIGMVLMVTGFALQIF
jgi:hypothetical protein